MRSSWQKIFLPQATTPSPSTWPRMRTFQRSFGAAHGYQLDLSDTLVPKERSHRLPSELSVRPLLSDVEWQAALECQVLVSTWGERGAREYLTPKFERYRSLSEKGRLVWLGAFLPNDIQVGNLGILLSHLGPPVARFQMVATHPHFQGRGVCRALLHAAINYISDTSRANPLFIIAADPHYHAKGIYQSIGFVEREYQVFATKLHESV